MEEFNYTKPINKYLYLLPNSITTLALFGGFFSILSAINHSFMLAAAGIFMSGVADMLDGRIARLTNTQSDFGNKFDSLSDLVAFGVAPAVTMYLWSLSSLGALGALIAFIYLLSAAFRLARFSTQTKIDDPAYFYGMPTPPMAALVAGVIWFSCVNHLDGEMVSSFTSIMMVIFALLMSSKIRYFSFKTLSLKKNPYFFGVSFLAIISSACVIGLPQIFFILIFFYFLSGPTLKICQLLRLNKVSS